MAFAAILFGVLGVLIVPDLVRHGAWSIVPNSVLIRWGTAGGRAQHNELLRRLQNRALSNDQISALLRDAETRIASSSNIVRRSGWQLLWSIEPLMSAESWRTAVAALQDSNPQVREDAILEINLDHSRCPEWVEPKLVESLAADSSAVVRWAALVECSRQLSTRAKERAFALEGTVSAENLEFDCYVRMARGEEHAWRWFIARRQLP